MNLDYTQIMNAPAPQGRVDRETMGGLRRQWDVCVHLLAKFTKAAKIDAGVKTCYLERGHKENMARRAAYYRKAVPRVLRELRAMEHYNFSLRVKAWVLGSKKRRLKLRALFGEKRLADWHARAEGRLAELADLKSGVNSLQIPEYKTSPEINHEINSGQVPGLVPGSRAANTELNDYALDPATSAGTYTDRFVQNDSAKPITKPVRKQNVRAWYILPRLPLLPRVNANKVHEKRAQPTPNLARAMPPIKFYPHELVEDYIPDDEAIYGAEVGTNPSANSEINGKQVPGFIPGSRAVNTKQNDDALGPVPQEDSLRSEINTGTDTGTADPKEVKPP